MAGVTTDNIRNVALVGHVGAGKTSLVDALLHRMGVIGRPGRVEDGSTVSDSEPEEQARRMSIRSSVVQVDWAGHRLNLLDTPGFIDFEADARAALHVADLAVFVVGATDGVGLQARTLWDEAERLRVPRMIFMNKLDAERADFDATLDEILTAFGEGVSVLELPIGHGADFHGVVDVEEEAAYDYHDGRVDHVPVPDDMAGTETAAHDALVETVVLEDDEMLEHFLEGDAPSHEQMVAGLRLAVADRTSVPVLCGSALTGVGVDRLAAAIVEIGPSPRSGPARTVTVGGTEEIELVPDPDEDPVLVVFKTISDEFVGQLSVCRVLTGTLRPGMRLSNATTGEEEHLHGLVSLRGATQQPVTEAVAGDVVALAKLSSTRTGDTLVTGAKRVIHQPLDWPDPAIAMAIAGQTPSDDDKLSEALTKVCLEDPTLHVERVDSTGQTLLRGVGPTQLDVAFERIARRFHVRFDTDAEHVAYLETITRTAQAEGRHKKQSGGHGQFAVVTLRVEPLGRGEGFRFDEQIVGGAIPRQFLSAVERGAREAMEDGGPHGYPVVDVAVTAVDGKAHSVDSSDLAFKTAAKLAFRAAVTDAAPVVLEPLVDLDVYVPAAVQGDVLADLGRRGRVTATESLGNELQHIRAVVPAEAVLTYVIDLRSLTAGRGHFHATHHGYDARHEPDTTADAVR